jgi:hypothetical protein
MAMTGSQFLEEGPEVAGVAAIDLNPGRLTLVFDQPRYEDLFFAFSVLAIPLKGSGRDPVTGSLRRGLAVHHL